MSANSEAPFVESEEGRRRVPLWALVCYAVLIPWVVFALGWMIYKMRLQSDTRNALDAIEAGGQEEMSLSQAKDVLKRAPVVSIKFLIQELEQDPDKDMRMAQANALRRVAEWTKISERRMMLEQLVAHMRSDGSVDAAFVMDSKQRTVLKELIEERKADKEAGYEETRITEVLEWIYEGAPGTAKGYERTRVQKVLDSYVKKQLRGNERKAVEALMGAWSKSTDAVEKGIAPKLSEVSAGKPVEFSAEEKEFCLKRADEFEEDYRQSCVNIAQALLDLCREYSATQRRLAHPIIFEMTVLLGYKYKEVRETIAEALFALRYNKYVTVFASEEALKARINPVMAVETAKLTNYEHERLLTEENDLRRGVAVDLLGRLQIDFCKKPYGLLGAYKEVLDPEQANEFMHVQVVKALESLLEDKTVGERAARVLGEIKKECPSSGS